MTLIWGVLVGIIIGGIIFNAKIRRSTLDFFGGLVGSGSGGTIIRRKESGDREPAEGHYRTAVHCSNCGFKGEIELRRGKSKQEAIASSVCPDCGCKALKG